MGVGRDAGQEKALQNEVHLNLASLTGRAMVCTDLVCRTPAYVTTLDSKLSPSMDSDVAESMGSSPIWTWCSLITLAVKIDGNTHTHTHCNPYSKKITDCDIFSPLLAVAVAVIIVYQIRSLELPHGLYIYFLIKGG